MSVTFAVNYKEIYSTETVEKIEELSEENSYALDDILTFIDENSEDDFVSYYEEYCTAGEKIGYDAVDTFVKYHGMRYVEYVEEAFRGVYHDGASFAEYYYENVCGDDIPAFVVVDWEATWNQSLSYDFDLIDGYVFSSHF